MRVTMKDVASVMGVSVMTVSNAFNRPDQLSGELRDRILQRAEKMGYTGPDATARQLRSGRSNTYAVIFQEKLSYAFSDPFSVLWLAAFARVMEQRRASVLLLSVPAGDGEALATIQNTAADGFVGLCPDQVGMHRARERGLPTVVCSLGPPGTEAASGDYVVVDDFAAGRDLGEYLRRLGHERVDLLVETMIDVTEPTVFTPEALAAELEREGRPEFLDSWLRLQGILAGLADATVRVVLAGANARESSLAAAPLILDRQDRPTAVIAISDILALGLIQACRDRGLTPGTDLSIAGFDDLPESAAAGLTTIAQPIAEKGRIAAELLLDPEQQPRQVVLPHRLVVRSSTQPAPSH